VTIFYSVRAFARAHFPHRVSSENDIRFSIRFTKDDEISGGDSAGLPMAIAFLSALFGLPIPNDIAMSGRVVCDAHDVIMVRRVGDVDAKIEGALERRIRRLLLPLENRADVERAERIPREVARKFVVYVATLEDACRELFPGIG
jgi:predicted ATP-dependent protease